MSDNEVRLGVLGLGSRSTLFYIELLNKLYNKRMGGWSTCPFVMLNCNFDDFNPHLPYQFTVLDARLNDALDDLEQLGANLLLIPNITLHHSYDRLGRTTPIAHPIELATGALVKDGYSKAYILGTRFTMQSSHMKEAIRKNGVEPLEPSEADIAFVDSFRRKVYDSAESIDDTADFLACISRLRKEHPVVLACTELSVLELGDEDGVYDMAALQVTDCIDQLMYK